uniref:Uncharacterized protein n=1 Tax=Gopherus agassizii TaxID=38772 RepID=A0A452IF80_9SAUR
MSGHTHQTQYCLLVRKPFRNSSPKDGFNFTSGLHCPCPLLIRGDVRLECAAEKLPPLGVSKACSFCVRSIDGKETAAAYTQCDQYMCQRCRNSINDCNGVSKQVLCSDCPMSRV